VEPVNVVMPFSLLSEHLPPLPASEVIFPEVDQLQPEVTEALQTAEVDVVGALPHHEFPVVPPADVEVEAIVVSEDEQPPSVASPEVDVEVADAISVRLVEVLKLLFRTLPKPVFLKLIILVSTLVSVLCLLPKSSLLSQARL